MSEFKLSATLYISQWNGATANPGTADQPYSHPADYGSSTTLAVIGAGYYRGVWTGFKNLTADGEVVLDLLGGTLSHGAFAGQLFRNLTLKNGELLCGNHWFNCVFENIGAIHFVGSTNSTDRNVFLHGPTIGNGRANFSIFFRDNLANPGNGFGYNFVDKSTVMELTGTTGIHNSCINAKLRWSGIDYELKRLWNGDPRPDADPNIPDAINIISNIYTSGNFACVDPKFIDIKRRIVQPDSDLLRRSTATGFIGMVKPGKAIKKTDTDPNITIVTSQIDISDPANWTIQAGYDEGFLYITFKLSDNLVQVPNILIDALLSFDGKTAGGSLSNNNVPDFFPTLYSPLTQKGLKPNRLTYGLRTSQNISKPTSESHWDNDSAALSTDVARYYVQEWNVEPGIYNVLGVTYGAGNPESIGATRNAINARWVQIQVRLTNKRTT